MNSKTLQLRKKLLIQKKALRFKTIEIPYENFNANDERLTMLKKNNNTTIKCKYCPKTWKNLNGSTSNPLKHWQQCHIQFIIDEERRNWLSGHFFFFFYYLAFSPNTKIKLIEGDGGCLK